MGDLISRSALLRKKTRMTEYDETGCGVHVIVVRADDIENAPAVDAEPVRHGHWLRTDAYPHHVYCSCCYNTFVTNEELMERYKIPNNFCSNCGARMDAEENT